jgi:hypothetical protein
MALSLSASCSCGLLETKICEMEWRSITVEELSTKLIQSCFRISQLMRTMIRALDNEKRSEFSFSLLCRNRWMDGESLRRGEWNVFSVVWGSFFSPEVKLGLGTAEDGALGYSLLFPDAAGQLFEPGIHGVGSQAATNLYRHLQVTTKEGQILSTYSLTRRTTLLLHLVSSFCDNASVREPSEHL